MKREKNFYYLLITIIFVITYIVSYLLSVRTIKFGAILATANVIIYPLTYFISTLYYERYGKEKFSLLLDFAIISLIFTGILVTVSSLLPVYNGPDGLNALFNIDFRILFASLMSFYLGQYINYKIYCLLDYKKWFNFLVSATIGITLDSLFFVLLGYLGYASFKDILILFSGQYAISVGIIIIYALVFYNIINNVKDVVEELHEDEKEIITDRIFDEEYEKEAKQSTETKKTTRKKSSTTKKTTKKTTNKNKAS